MLQISISCLVPNTKTMKTLIEILDWPETILNKTGDARIGLSSNGSDTCLMPSKKYKELQVRLEDLLPLGSHLIISDEILTVEHESFSPLSVLYYVNLLLIMYLYVTGKKHLIGRSPFDEFLTFFDNPGTSDIFPFNRPLLITGVYANLKLIEHKPAVVMLDETTGNKWALSTALFCLIKYISVET